MGFQQLYYTSCEVGLSGFPGFQFNAASDDIPPEVMRRVETLTAYDPPGSVPYNADAQTIAACPVNLCYEPADNGSVLANVVFVGSDYSNRFGNYFAHALVTADLVADLGTTLPIEMWGSPIWARTPVGDTRLAHLPSRPAAGGLLDRAAAGDFLAADRRRREVLPALLTAVVTGMTGQRRSTVLIERDSEAAAHWIAAISYLLPSSLARRMSFATYHHRPSFADLDLVATVPDADVDRGANGFASFVQFDLPAGRASEVRVEPWAELLARIGPVEAGELWAAAARLTGDVPHEPDDWFPLLSAALFDLRDLVKEAGPADVVASAMASAAWLASQAAELRPDDVARLGALALPFLPDGPAALPGLANLAAAAHGALAHDLAVVVEKRATDLRVASLVDPARAGRQYSDDEIPPPRTPEGRAHAAEQCGRAFYGQVDSAAALRLLEWAAAAGLALNPALLERLGERLIGPMVVARPAGGSAADRLAGAWPELRAGALTHLAAVAEESLERTVEVLSGPFGQGVTKAEAAGWPALADARLVAQGRHAGDQRVDVLARLAARRLARPGGAPARGGAVDPGDTWGDDVPAGARHGGARHSGPSRGGPGHGGPRHPGPRDFVLGADVLRLLWPAGPWTPAEARRVLAEVDPRALAGPPVTWLENAIAREDPGAGAGYLDELDRLRQEVAASPVAASLTGAAAEIIARGADTDRRVAAAARKGPASQAAVLVAELDQLRSADNGSVLRRLERLVDKQSPMLLPEVFATFSARALSAYLRAVEAELRPDHARIDLAARLYYAQYRLRRERSRENRKTGNDLVGFLLGLLVDWRFSTLKTVEHEIHRIDRGAAKEFKDWRDVNAGGWMRRQLAERRLKNEETERRAAHEARRRAQEPGKDHASEPRADGGRGAPPRREDPGQPGPERPRGDR
ncbi:hypothetical protein I6A84_42990 [Frankia sp. CNm7]|uniref:GTPase-associated protein 1-related protein n=2 Tax=Frankia nepalensis TaxID=1836974 RepID=UPI001932CCD2|nr:GTPase-associated protein 1-related protein [Frankia nepalensis]MBL7524631.1 hypothetical protein [Frankia nepalensis]